ncbi:MAG: DoxX family protein [Mycobacterium sp.]|uniref:DoxX family protein n=1 Tax=Mycobacterium sp. TaxID=1785 RepID=UPI00261AB643|nr:DoxX family protein [Mycobacterium sp.]MDI3314247.1 DoxX family protein [Mycobacterium sp.]
MTSQSNDSDWRPPDDSGAQTQLRPASASLVDPEDDLPSAAYSGDFETTAIPHYGPGGPLVAGSRYGLAGPHDEVSYGRQRPGGRHSAAPPDQIEADEDDERVRAAGRRGTQDLGLLILRVGLGIVLIAHGLQTLFGWWGGRGRAGFTHSLTDAGYRHAEILSYVGPGGEIGAGVLLVLGLVTPLAAAGALAYLINELLAGVSTQPHSRFSFFLPHGHEYELTLILVAIAVVLIGPGRYGFDAGRGWARRPFIGSLVSLLGGVGAGVAVWVLLNGANPLG